MRLPLGIFVVVLAWSGCASAPPADVKADTRELGPERAERFAKPAPIPTIDSDAVVRDPERNAYVFTGHVALRTLTWTQQADRVDVFFNADHDAIERIEATGHVRLATADCVRATASRTVYHGRNGIAALYGDARVSHWYRSLKFRDTVIELGNVPLPWLRCRDEVMRRVLLALVPGERGDDAEADVHPARDPALAGQEARARP